MLARRVTARLLSHGPAVSRWLRAGGRTAAFGQAALFPPAFAGTVGARGRSVRWASQGTGSGVEGTGAKDGAVEEAPRVLTVDEQKEKDVLDLMARALARLLDGRERMEEGKLEEAVAELDETIKALNASGSEWAVPPTHAVIKMVAEARYLAAAAWQKLGNWEKAVEHLELAVLHCKSWTDVVPAYEYALGNGHLALGNHRTAITHFENFGNAGGLPPGLDPNLIATKVHVPFMLAQLLVSLGILDEAEKVFINIAKALEADLKGIPFDPHTDVQNPPGERADGIEDAAIIKDDATPAAEKPGSFKAAEGGEQAMTSGEMLVAAHYWLSSCAVLRLDAEQTLLHLERFDALAEHVNPKMLEDGWERNAAQRSVKAFLTLLSAGQALPPAFTERAEIKARSLVERIAPEDPLSSWLFGDTLALQGKMNEAAAAYGAVLTILGPNGAPHRIFPVALQRGGALLAVGDAAEAESAFELAAAASNGMDAVDESSAWVGVASSILDQLRAGIADHDVRVTKTERAIQMLGQAMGNLHGRTGQAAMGLRSQCLLTRAALVDFYPSYDITDRGEEMLREAALLVPQDGNILVELARVLTANGKVAEAKEITALLSTMPQQALQ